MRVKNRPFFVKLLVPMLVLAILEVALLVQSVFGGGLISYMEDNEIEILHEKVVNRKRYLENEMVTRWADINGTVEAINAETQRLIDEGQISLDNLDSSSEAAQPLIKSVAEDLISMMRSNKVTGAFMVLNTANLESAVEAGKYVNKPGIYIRDCDPTSTPSVRNMDLLLEYAPPEVVKSLNISLDKRWASQFDFAAKGEYTAYLYEPFQAAFTTEDRTEMKASDFGRWSEPYQLNKDSGEVIAYSVPLMLEDGRVYGVLGIDISMEYLKSKLPWKEVADSEKGSYLLGIERDSNTEVENVFISGETYQQINEGRTTTLLQQNGNRLLVEDAQKRQVYCDVQYLDLYDANAAFSGERWVLLGIVDGQDLFAFSDRVKYMLNRGTLCTFLTGIAGAFLISIFVAKPVISLTKNVQKMKPFDRVSLSKTGISEIDLLAESLEKLNEETLYTAEKFSYIIDTAKLQIAVFEVNWEEKTVFITGRFFEMLGMPKQQNPLFEETAFWKLLDSIEPCREPEQVGDSTELMYCIPAPEEDTDAEDRYVRLSLKDDGNHCVGLLEDVTDNEREKASIEYERDHDILTGLLNRRAFRRRAEELFAEGGKTLKTAALVMIDLDGLKHANDTYGHDYGDKYIQMAAQCFLKFTPDTALVSRLSGDEFHLFFYGYDNKEQIREQFAKLRNGIQNTILQLPDGTASAIRMSAGVAWYPEDSTEYAQLHAYSDVAMYQIKHGTKNEWAEFEKESITEVRGESSS